MANSANALRQRRKWLPWLVGLLVLPVLAVLAIPWALSTGAGRAWLLSRANRTLAPGGLELATLRFSWFGPTRMTGLVLRDARGDPVVSAPRATWDRNLRQVLFEQPKLGTFRLFDAAIDAERAADGSIDLYETLRPLIGRNPRTAIRIEMPDGRLRFRGKGLRQPFTAEHAEILVVKNPVPGPLVWNVRLVNGPAATPANALKIDGRLDRGSATAGRPDDLEIRVVGHQWPWSLGGETLAGSGRLDGSFRAARKAGMWSTSGDLTLRRLDVAGDALAGDRLRLEQAKGVWDLAQAEAGWSVRRFDLTSALLTLKAEGATRGEARLNGRVDLAALAGQLPRALRLRDGVVLERGTAEVAVETKTVQGAAVLDVQARVSDLRARNQGRPFTLRDPATLAARLRRVGALVEVEWFTADTPFLKGEAQGDLTRGVTLTGSIDLAALQSQLRDLVDFGAVELAGKGGLTGTYRATDGTYHGRLRTDLRSVRVLGLGPVSVERESAGLSVDVDGPAAGSGLPAGWQGLQARLTSGDFQAQVTAGATGPGVTAVVSFPVSSANREARVEGRVAAVWDQLGVAIDPVSVSLSSADGGKSGVAPLRFQAKGRFDRARGELTLRATEGDDRAGVIRLAGGGLRVLGLGGGDGLRFEGAIAGDLAGQAAWIPAAPEGLRGRWSAWVSGRSGDDGLQIGGRLDLPAFAWGTSEGQPVDLAVRGLLPNGGGRFDLAEFVLNSRYLTLEASGRVVEPGGRRLADLRGTLTPHWESINAWLAAHVEPGAAVSGRPRSFRVKGPLGDGWRDALDGDVGVRFDGADLYGMRFGPTAVVLRARAGKLGFDAIETTVNEGRLHLEPGVRAGDDRNRPAIVLGKGSSLTGAHVNDEVSRRVLSYVAPVLDHATRVRGQVSARVDEAVFPIGGEGGTGPKVEGSVEFQDVVFTPGPLFEVLGGLIDLEDKTLLRLDEAVSLKIADRRVYQRGLSIPVGKVTRIGIDGWVGFDRSLNLTASIPVLPAMRVDRPVLEGIAGNARVRVPIRGTLDKPEIDQDAFQAGIKETARSLIGGGVAQGASALLQKMLRGRDADPDAPSPPPRMTPAERKARRLEKRAERRSARGLPP